MNDLPSNQLSDNDIATLQNAGQLIIEAKELKEQPSKLRHKLVDIQAARFDIGKRRDNYKGHARDLSAKLYAQYKMQGMSPNAAYKEAEMDVAYVKLRNTYSYFETAYDVLDSFVNTNQTSLRLASEEAKNNL